MFKNNMEIIINWEEIKSEEAFFEVFLPQVSAPEWHGNNLNALRDSIVTGDINAIEPPYTIINRNNNSVSGTLKEFQEIVFKIFQEAIDEKRKLTIVNQ